MAILSGKRLGPYEVLSAVGAGGMGEVYRARDTRLERIVAVKILPDHLSDRAELRERFEREARTIASLNHPHICTLHDIGHQDGIDYLLSASTRLGSYEVVALIGAGGKGEVYEALG
jgi:serine/threonine protein kinase